MQTLQQSFAILVGGSGLIVLILLWRLNRAANSAAKVAGSTARAIGAVAKRNPETTVRVGQELWKFLSR